MEWYGDGTGVELVFEPDGEIIVLVDKDGAVHAESAHGLRDSFLAEAIRYFRRD